MRKTKGHGSCPGYVPEREKRVRVKQTDCKDVEEIIEALTYENEIPRAEKERKRLLAATKKLLKYPQFKTKPFKPPHFKDTCVPMEPSMHTRLKYIGHCPLQPPYEDYRTRRKYDNYYFAPSSEEEEIPPGGVIRRKRRKTRDKYFKRVRYYELMPGDILMPTPVPVVKHTASDKSILSVPSPKTSGEVIQAKKATVKPGDLVPPLPPKAAHELYKPHSGIILNRDQDFVPTVVHMPGKLPLKKKGGKNVCEMNLCDKKKCRKYAELRKQRYLKKMRRRYPHGTYSSLDGKRRRRRLKGKKLRLKDGEACGLDDVPPQEQVHIPPNLKRGTLQTHSLTVLPCTKDRKPEIHFGILVGTFNMYDNKFGKSRGRQALPVCVMAYCLAFHYHPKQWTMKLIDNLMNAGDQWYLQCLDKVHDHTAYQGICEVLPFAKKQILLLNGKRMQILLGEPDIVGYTMSLDPTVYNLCRGLKAFFQENRGGVMLSRVLKVIIWKDKVCYYIFDPAGRDARAYSNFTNGKAALINVKDLDSVAEVLLARSILEDQKFVLAPVKVLKMVDAKIDDDLESEELTHAEKAMLGYKIMSENFAVVNASMHLGDRCFEEAKFRQALPIAIVAMTYAKISPPNTWFSRTVDKILRLGNKLYLDCMHPKVMTDLTIDNIPNEITVGTFTSEIMIYRERIKGQLFTMKECLLNIKSGLQEFFSHENNCGILEFCNYHLAVWRQKDMFYMFDPYPRTPDGLRALRGGKACVMMFLNPETMADAFSKNFDYLPPTTLFNIHAFKVLKLKKKDNKLQIHCTLSGEHVHGKPKKTVLAMSKAQGDGRDSDGRVKLLQDILPGEPWDLQNSEAVEGVDTFDEEQMGDIISMVDSIDDEFVPRVPAKYKKMADNIDDEPYEPKVVNLDSPTVSVTQVVPPWPQPRDKTNEPPEPDPEPEPTPPPTPPVLPPPEGAEEEAQEEAVEEEEDEETAARKKEEAKRKKAEEEEARRKAEELPPPLPPPPSPQAEPEVPLAPVQPDGAELEILETLEPVAVDRHVLLTEDAKYRSKLRQIRKKITPPLAEEQFEETQPIEIELSKPSNFKELPDTSQIISGTTALSEDDASKNDLLPFGAIMAIVTSYKYSINTWTPGIVNFVVDTAQKLYENKQSKFQLAPVHIIPKIALGHQAYHATIDVIGEGPSWQLKDILERKFFSRYDRAMVTTSSYSCAIFKRNGLYYLFDGSPCNAMGLREPIGAGKGKACFLRFSTIHGLASRILYNKDGPREDQQFILSRILVRRLLKDPRYKLPEDYDYEAGEAKSKKSKTTLASPAKEKKKSISTDILERTVPGYQLIDSMYRIEGTTAINDPRKPSTDVKSCHFVSLIAMLMAAMHPIRTWDHFMVDTCIEKGLEIYNKATNLSVCEKRVIKNVILDGKFININIKKILVVNENVEKTLEQYLKAVMRRLRYVIIRYPQCSVVLCKTDGYFHLFDPYPPLTEDSKTVAEEKETGPDRPSKKGNYVATWTLYRSIDALIRRFKKVLPGKTADSPEFYTFELTSVKPAPRHSALHYRLSPLFKPDENPNVPYLKRRKIRPLVDEKMYWLNVESIPWSRMNAVNDLGFERKTPKTMWKDWDIEFPGDLFSLWGTTHPLHLKFDEDYRGQQYLAVSVIALAMSQVANFSAWTSGLIDGIVNGGNKYHIKCLSKVGSAKNHEVVVTDLDTKFDDMFPFSFGFKFEKIIFGFVYNLLPDRFNLSKALSYFFEKNRLGILTSPTKNLAFGKEGASYFMFDCQSYGAPIFSPGKGVAYILKCESLNRLIYVMTMTLNIRRHGQQFHLYSVDVTAKEKTK